MTDFQNPHKLHYPTGRPRSVAKRGASDNAWVKEQEDHAAWVTAGKPVPIIGGDTWKIPDHAERLERLERAVFAAKDDWPTGHDSLQAQLDELYALYGQLKLASTVHKDMGEGFTHHDEGCECQQEDVPPEMVMIARADLQDTVNRMLNPNDWIPSNLLYRLMKALDDAAPQEPKHD